MILIFKKCNGDMMGDLLLAAVFYTKPDTFTDVYFCEGMTLEENADINKFIAYEKVCRILRHC